MRSSGLLLLLFVKMAHANTFKVFHNTFDPAVFGTTGGAHHNATGDGYVDALSICIRFQFANLAGNDEEWKWRAQVFKLSDMETGRKLLETTAGMYISIFVFGYPVTKTTFSGYILNDDGEYSIYKPRQWNHLCFSWSSGGYSKVVLNGKFLVNYVDENLSDLKIPKELLLRASLMSCGYLPVEEQTKDCTAPGGMATDFNIWDRAMGDEELIDWTTCNKLSKGNLINWDDSPWILDPGMVWIEKEMDEICLLPQPKDIIFPEPRTNADFHLLCNKLKGHLSVADTQSNMDSLIEEFKLQRPDDFKGYQSSMFWAGYNDIKDDGWRNELTGKLLNRNDGFWPWLVSEPNGGTLENCACVVASQNGWNDYMCFEKTKGFCKIQPRPRLILRGLPEDLERYFDNKYTMATNKFLNGHYSFDGYTSTRIIFDNGTQLWRLELLSDTSIHATTELIPTDYPLGNRIWDVATPIFNGKLELNLNSCDDFNSFSCNDGACITIEERCNGNNDCNDASDEENCDKISVPETYLPDVPAPPIEDNLLADVFMSIDVNKVLNLVEVDETMVLKYRLTLKWKDSRVKFRNLKQENYLNTLGPDEAGKIWYPKVIFYNTKDTEETKRNGTATISPLEVMQNDHIYSGIENELILSQVYTTSFTCEYDMAAYPFDVQKCSMIFIMQGNSGNFAKLHMTELNYLGAVDLTQYFVKNYTFSDADEYLNISTYGNKGVQVDFIFSRRLLNQILTVFMPTMAIVIVSFCTSFFKPSDFEANVTVNVTTLLVLTTLFISISDALPRTSYVKAVDTWLITNLMIPFFEIILQSLMNIWYKDNEEEDDTRLFRISPTSPANKDNNNRNMNGIHRPVKENDKLLSILRLLTRTVLPGFYILFCFVFFIYGMMQA